MRIKAQEKVKSSEIVQPDTLADLVVPDEQAQELKVVPIRVGQTAPTRAECLRILTW